MGALAAAIWHTANYQMYLQWRGIAALSRKEWLAYWRDFGRTTWGQVGPNGYAISRARYDFDPGRRHGWVLWRADRPDEHDPTVIRRHYVCAERDADHPTGSSGALEALMQQAEAITGIPADGWQRNPRGDYVSREVNKDRPLRWVEG
jgi:hypothetical protein